METVFKENQEVFDEVFREGKKGIVRIVSKNKFRNYILVDFENSTPALYTFEGILIDIDGESVYARPTLSVFETKYVSKEDFKKIPTFEEAWKKTMRLYEPKSEYNKEEYKGYPSQELADASEALRRLLFLRDYYNEGWKPDWNDDRITKWTIEVSNNSLNVTNEISFSRPLYFKTELLAEKFLEEQRELLEIAKILL